MKPNAKRYTWGDRSLTVGQWVKEPDVAPLGLGANALYARLTGGCWTIEAALTTPKGTPNPDPIKAPKTASQPASKRPSPPRRSSGPQSVLDLIHEQRQALAAQLSALELAANTIATSAGLPAPYEVA